MDIDFDKHPLGTRGEPIKDSLPEAADILKAMGIIMREDPAKPVGEALTQMMEALTPEPDTLADYAHGALVNTKAANECKPPEKRERFNLARKVASGGVVELGEGERKLLVKALETHCTSASLVACEELLVPVKVEDDADDPGEPEESKKAESEPEGVAAE